MSTPVLRVGDLLLTPHGEERVLEFDLPTDTVVTASGTWYIDEIEPTPPPDPGDQDALDRWLASADYYVAPSLGIVTTSVRCEGTCGCKYCHRNISRDRTQRVVGRFHFRDSGQCQCPGAADGGPSCC